jgi:hypothetical protein
VWNLEVENTGKVIGRYEEDMRGSECDAKEFGGDRDDKG